MTTRNPTKAQLVALLDAIANGNEALHKYRKDMIDRMELAGLLDGYAVTDAGRVAAHRSDPTGYALAIGVEPDAHIAEGNDLRTEAERVAAGLSSQMIGTLGTGHASAHSATVIGRPQVMKALRSRGLIGNDDRWTRLGLEVAAIVLGGRVWSIDELHVMALSDEAHAEALAMNAERDTQLIEPAPAPAPLTTRDLKVGMRVKMPAVWCTSDAPCAQYRIVTSDAQREPYHSHSVEFDGVGEVWRSDAEWEIESAAHAALATGLPHGVGPACLDGCVTEGGITTCLDGCPRFAAVAAANRSTVRPIAVGDRVRGRDVTMGSTVEGAVTGILYPRGLGYYQDEPTDRPVHSRRYHITADDGRTRIVECAERIEPPAAPEPDEMSQGERDQRSSDYWQAATANLPRVPAFEPPAPADGVSVDQWIAEQVAQLSENELLMVKGVLDDIAAGRPVEHFAVGTKVYVGSYGTTEFVVQGTAPWHENGVVSRKVEIRSTTGNLSGHVDPRELRRVDES
ncbi:hypothetical protein BDK92_7176 [Micromonospora pisi]|uniref:Uncharacterized protein n=1 Tax=Micromonospora pisi TaxID=589240 RepID=A0A495JVU0_9ACTN|nr:hypothetical protein [Micromonospora pisi]RKR92698.1 hypothetical protein BDK92_7176 [Micromonospora pisi]